MPELENEKRDVRITTTGPDFVTISGLTRNEIEIIRGSINGGFYWVRRNRDEGGIQSEPSYLPLPDPVEDQEMYPFWRKPTPSEIQISEAQLKLFDIGEMFDHNSPSIIITGLCAYNYTPENYKIEAEKLTSYGFICTRSKRSDEGKFWENWFLPGLFFAKGKLQEALPPEVPGLKKDRLQEALHFLRMHVNFGSLDVCVQRLALVFED